MANKQNKEAKNKQDKRDSGLPGGGQGRRDEVGKTGVYPVSDMANASPDATVHDQASFGQGERGAEGYEDSGGSELTYIDEERGIIGGAAPTGESGEYQNAEDLKKAQKAQSKQ